NAIFVQSSKTHAVEALALGEFAAVYGQGDDTVGTGLAGQGGELGVHGYSQSGVAVLASSDNGRGLVAVGGRAPLQLLPSVTAGPPASGEHTAGELVVDSAHNLFLCVADGTPGTWRRIGGPSTGSFSPLTPMRVYDSRWPGEAGQLTSGADRTISVGDARAVAGGAIVTADVVPAGAIAVSYNITAVDTLERGFLAVNPGGVTAVSAAALNWSASGLVVGNASTAALGGDRQLTIVCGGAGAATNVVVDIVGYHA
ncbi:MAG: hypothetical protein KDB21_11025, partial [Acidimicrobiales bacterium]|nr:hypothetical protein [Acidimicrobiales bacterium]